jgi:hypothetical protein
VDLITLIATLALSIGIALGVCRVMLGAIFFTMTRSAFHVSSATFEEHRYDEHIGQPIAPAA